MTKLLYINSHPGNAEYSKSQQIAEDFLQSYLAKHPDAQVTKLDLWQLDAPDVDSVVYSAFGVLMSGGSFENLNAEQQNALMKRQIVIDQFIAHDKYIFVAPMWEFSFPSVLKKYLDIICAARQTFQYNEFGLPVGLLKNKKAVFVQASGGVYSPEARAGFRPMLADHPQAEELLATFDQLGNYGEPIVRATLAIMGVHDYQHIMVPLQAKPDYAAAEFNSSLTKAKQLATTW
ncbi:MAG TPA: NAD(P)H-dependent oxidoreductase [Burkholderiales bacterium]|nr:NAD(P)H-dependent oxidoreductase [Burkholderiales bacterium]